MNKKSILVFGVGELQKSLILQARKKGLFVVGIDPVENAFCRDAVDAFEVVDGQDFEATLAVAKKYSVSAIVTAATDKPLVMMARVAEKLKLRFYSVQTAMWATDKYQMKQRFIAQCIPCAKGCLIKASDEINDFNFPVIVKPRDNSGSRGVKLCKTLNELKKNIEEALQFSRFDSVLVEEYIEGMEYSIEALHYEGKTEIIQCTEKKTTDFPYSVELGHKQPANLSQIQMEHICHIISKVASTLKFENCPSHTEIKINERGVFVIETSPRLGGDFITSTLVPLSTGINLEDQLLNLSLGEEVDIKTNRVNHSSGICFFNFSEGEVKKIDNKIKDIVSWKGIVDFNLKLNVGDKIGKITSSLNRYGYFIVSDEKRKNVDLFIDSYEENIKKLIYIGEK